MKVAIILLLAAMLSVSNLHCPNKDEREMAELINNTKKAASNAEIQYFNADNISKSIRYMLVCDKEITKEDREKVRVEAVRYEHKYNIPVYEVSDRRDANMIIRLK